MMTCMMSVPSRLPLATTVPSSPTQQQSITSSCPTSTCVRNPVSACHTFMLRSKQPVTNHVPPLHASSNHCRKGTYGVIPVYAVADDLLVVMGLRLEGDAGIAPVDGPHVHPIPTEGHAL